MERTMRSNQTNNSDQSEESESTSNSALASDSAQSSAQENQIQNQNQRTYHHRHQGPEIITSSVTQQDYSGPLTPEQIVILHDDENSHPIEEAGRQRRLENNDVKKSKLKPKYPNGKHGQKFNNDANSNTATITSQTTPRTTLDTHRVTLETIGDDPSNSHLNGDGIVVAGPPIPFSQSTIASNLEFKEEKLPSSSFSSSNNNSNNNNVSNNINDAVGIDARHREHQERSLSVSNNDIDGTPVGSSTRSTSNTSNSSSRELGVRRPERNNNEEQRGREQEEPTIHILEATLVVEEPPPPIYDAIPMPEQEYHDSNHHGSNYYESSINNVTTNVSNNDDNANANSHGDDGDCDDNESDKKSNSSSSNNKPYYDASPNSETDEHQTQQQSNPAREAQNWKRRFIILISIVVGLIIGGVTATVGSLMVKGGGGNGISSSSTATNVLLDDDGGGDDEQEGNQNDGNIMDSPSNEGLQTSSSPDTTSKGSNNNANIFANDDFASANDDDDDDARWDGLASADIIDDIVQVQDKQLLTTSPSPTQFSTALLKGSASPSPSVSWPSQVFPSNSKGESPFNRPSPSPSSPPRQPPPPPPPPQPQSPLYQSIPSPTQPIPQPSPSTNGSTQPPPPPPFPDLSELFPSLNFPPPAIYPTPPIPQLPPLPAPSIPKTPTATTVTEPIYTPIPTSSCILQRVDSSATSGSSSSCSSFNATHLGDLYTAGCTEMDFKHVVATDGSITAFIDRDFNSVYISFSGIVNDMPTSKSRVMGLDYQPSSLAVSGNVVAIGCALNNTVVIFEWDSSNVHEGEFVELQPGISVPYYTDMNFGYSVDIDGDILVVGSRYNGYSEEGGYAYVYRRIGMLDWVEEDILSPKATNATTFGSKVSIKGSVIVVGFGWFGTDMLGFSKENDWYYQEGFFHVYKRDGAINSWQRLGDEAVGSKECRMFFAVDVHLLDEHQLLVACHADAASFMETLFYYTLSDSTDDSYVVMTHKITVSGSTTHTALGFPTRSIVSDGNIVALGSESEHDGRVYVYVVENGVWTEKLVVLPPVAEKYFGYSIAMEGNKLLVSSNANLHLYLMDCLD